VPEALHAAPGAEIHAAPRPEIHAPTPEVHAARGRRCMLPGPRLRRGPKYMLPRRWCIPPHGPRSIRRHTGRARAPRRWCTRPRARRPTPLCTPHRVRAAPGGTRRPHPAPHPAPHPSRRRSSVAARVIGRSGRAGQGLIPTRGNNDPCVMAGLAGHPGLLQLPPAKSWVAGWSLSSGGPSDRPWAGHDTSEQRQREMVLYQAPHCLTLGCRAFLVMAGFSELPARPHASPRAGHSGL